jgi:hypothetical protein
VARNRRYSQKTEQPDSSCGRTGTCCFTNADGSEEKGSFLLGVVSSHKKFAMLQKFWLMPLQLKEHRQPSGFVDGQVSVVLRQKIAAET